MEVQEVARLEPLKSASVDQKTLQVKKPVTIMHRVCKNSCSLLIPILLLSLFPSAPSVKGQQDEVDCETREEFNYFCSYDFETGYLETPKAHTIDVKFKNLESGSHRIEIDILTNESLRFIQLLTPVTGKISNASLDGKVSITLNTEETNPWLRFVLNNTAQVFDPIDVASLPLGQSKHPMTDEGKLNLNFWTNISQKLNECSFRFRSSDDSKILGIGLSYSDIASENVTQDPDASRLVLNNPSVGNGEVHFDALSDKLHSFTETEITATKTVQYTPVECRLNGTVVRCRNLLSAIYILSSEFAFQSSFDVWYGTGKTYYLSFTSLPTFTLRLGVSEREKVESLQFEQMPSKFSVSKTNYMDEPCYVFEFQFQNTSQCYFSLNLRPKEWLIDPENMTLEEIPKSVKEKYLASYSSIDGDYFSNQDQNVRRWAEELSINQTNPYFIALNIYKNLTNTIHVPQNWKELDAGGFFKENDMEGTNQLGCR